MKSRDTSRDQTMPRRAYSYKRVSQAKKRSTVGKNGGGDSFDRQDDFAESICREENWTLDDTLRFVDESRSGFHGDNLLPTADLARFLDLVQRGRIVPGSVLILENLDRLSRQDVDIAYDLFRGILRAGVWICTKLPRKIYKKESNSFMDIMEPIWLMYLAHQESLKKSDRVTHAWQSARDRARESGRPTSARPPAWLRRHAEGYSPIPERVALVRRIAEMARGGRGTGEIAALLNTEGETALCRSGHWAGSSVYQLLVSRTLIGEHQPHRKVDRKRVPEGPPIPGYYPAVLSEAEYLATRAALTARKGRRGRPARSRINLLTGLIVDVASGRRMSLQTVASHGGEIAYLAIGQVAGCTRVRYAEVEEAILETLAMLRPADVLDAPARDDAREVRIAELAAQFTALEMRKLKLQAAAADPSQDEADILPVIAQVSRDLKAVAIERERLTLETTTGRGEALREAQTLCELREGTEGEEREELDRRIKAALPLVVERVEVRAERVHRQAQTVRLRIVLRSGNHRDVRLDSVHSVRRGTKQTSASIPS